MKKKLLIALLAYVAALCMAFAFTACGENGGDSSETPENNEQPSEKNGTEEETEMIETIYLTVGTHKITVKLEENVATKALVELLKEDDISYNAHDYGGFEKVGDLGHTLPSEDKQMTTEADDVILYSGDQIVLFYGSNSWSYTKIGKMQGSASEIKEILTESNPVTVTISLQ